MMTPRFLTALDFVLRWETVYEKGHEGDMRFAIAENVPGDPGGTTKFGIDQRSHPEVNIELLTLDRARQIYDTSYWGPVHAEQLPAGWGEAAFDAAVNCGIGKAIQWLQQTLADTGLYHGAVDGLLGPLTLEAAGKATAVELGFYLDKRKHFYRRLVIARPEMKKFEAGWLNRMNGLTKFIRA
jgi:lysozyme family protein